MGSTSFEYGLVPSKSSVYIGSRRSNTMRGFLYSYVRLSIISFYPFVCFSVHKRPSVFVCFGDVVRVYVFLSDRPSTYLFIRL